METIYAATLIASALIFGICGAGTAVAFGNLFAGEVIFLIIALLGYWQFTLHFWWAVFHLLVIPLQAYLFMMLTIVYLNQAHQHH